MKKELSETIKEEEIDLLSIIGILYKHRFLIIALTTITAFVVVVYSILTIKLPSEKSPLPNLYKAVSTVRIHDSESSGGFSGLIESSGVGALAGLMGVTGGGASESAFIIEIAGSNTVIDQIVEEFDLLKVFNLEGSENSSILVRKAIKGRLVIEENIDSGTLSISFEDKNKVLATKIVNRAVDILEQKIEGLELSSNYTQRIIMEEKKTDVEKKISLIQHQIMNFQKKYNIINAKIISETIGNRIVVLKTSLVEKEAAIATYMEKSRIEDAVLIKLKDEKNAIENSLLALENGTISGLPALKDLPLIVMEYEELTRSLEVQATIYKTLIQQYELLKLQEGGTGPKFQIIEYAEVPKIKSGPSRGKLCIVATFTAFLLSIILAFLKEFWDNLKKDPDRMKKLKGLR